jgi:hypothetical protein
LGFGGFWFWERLKFLLSCRCCSTCSCTDLVSFFSLLPLAFLDFHLHFSHFFASLSVWSVSFSVCVCGTVKQKHPSFVLNLSLQISICVYVLFCFCSRF